MDGVNNNLRHGLALMRGGQWSSAQCVQKVEEMLSRAILHQEDLWNMLMIHSPEQGAGAEQALELATMGNMHPHQNNNNNINNNNTISPPVLRALKAKLENSMDWCHLALCRLKEIVPPAAGVSSSDHHHYNNNNNPPQQSGLQQPATTTTNNGVLSNSYNSKTSEAIKTEGSAPAAPMLLLQPSPRLKLPTPLSPLIVASRKERNSTPHLFTGPSTPSGRLGSLWSPQIYNLFNETPHGLMTGSDHTGEEDPSQQPMNMLAGSNVEHRQDQNFAGMQSNLNMDADWNMIDTPISNLPPDGPLASGVVAAPDQHQSSSSCQKNINVDGTDLRDPDIEDQSYVTKVGSRGSIRPRTGVKRDREASGEPDAKMVVVFQELKPGSDSKKGIPDDGHRGWKKYGNKSIQNSSFCRGYYKCSAKECKAKKMVQPTDKDPSMFEVTYVGKHTCSSTSQRKSRSRAAAHHAPAVAAAAAAPAPAAAPIDLQKDRDHPGTGSTADQEQAATNSDVPTTSTVTKEAGDAVLAACTTTSAMCAWDVPAGGAGSSEVEESSRATRSSEGSQGGDQDHKGENAGSYVSINGTHALTKPTLIDADSGYLDHSSQHQQSVFAFQEPLLWPEIMDTANLSPCLHVPIKS